MSEGPVKQSPCGNGGSCPPPIKAPTVDSSMTTVDQDDRAYTQALHRAVKSALDPTGAIGQHENLEARIMFHLIPRFDFLAQLPETLRSLGDPELLTLQGQLELTHRSSNRAARSLEALIRARKIPISREDLRLTAKKISAVVAARVKLGSPFEEVSLPDYRFQSDPYGHILEFTATTAAAKRLKQREDGYRPEILIPGEYKIVERAAIAQLVSLEAEGQVEYPFLKDLKMPRGGRIDRLWMRIGDASKDFWPSGADKVMKLAYALRLSADPRTGQLIERFPQYHPADWTDRDYYADGLAVQPFLCFLASISETNRRLLNKIATNTRKLIDTHCDKVKLIAEALLTRKRLSYQECVTLFYGKVAEI